MFLGVDRRRFKERPPDYLFDELFHRLKNRTKALTDRIRRTNRTLHRSLVIKVSVYQTRCGYERSVAQTCNNTTFIAVFF